MAFEQLGLNLIVQGVNTFVGDINRVNTSLMRYVGSMKNYETAMLKAAAADQRMADIRIMTSYKLLQKDTLVYNQLTADVEKYSMRANAAIARVLAITSGGGAATPAQKGAVTRNINQLQDAVTALTPANDRLVASQERLNHFTDLGAKANATYNSIANKSVSIWGLLGDTLGMVTKGFGNNVIQGTALGKVFLTLVPELAGFTFVLDALKIGFDLVVYGIKTFSAILGTLWNIVKKVSDVLLNLAKTLINYVWQGVQTVAKAIFNLATAPFQWVINGLQNIWKAIGNIIQITIGMSFDRILWGIAQRLREIADEALEAGSQFQLMQIRLTGLIQREMSETKVAKFSESLGVASQRAKELSNWISKLGVTSIFSTNQIANVMTLAMSYDYTEEQAKTLTTAIVKFATAMGLGDQEMVRIVENMGQMKAAGKMTGQELRDLARGAFVPTARVFQVMADMEMKAGNGIMQYKIKAEYAKKTQAELNKLIKAGVKVYDELGKKAPDWKELRELGRTGDIPVQKFVDAFIEMTNQDFPNAIENAKASMQVLESNIKDFIESFIGWRVVTPVLDVISGRLNKIMNVLISDEARTKFEIVGKAFASIFANVMDFFDQRGPDIASAITKVIDGITLISQVAAEVIKGNFYTATTLTFGTDYWKSATKLPSMSADTLANMRKTIGAYSPYSFLTNPMQNQEQADSVDTLGQAFRQNIYNIVKMIENNKDKIDSFLKDPIAWIRDNGIQIVKNLVTEGFEFLKTKAEEALGYINQWWTDNGGTIVNGIGTLLQGALSNVASFVAKNFGLDNPLYAFLGVVKAVIGLFTAEAMPASTVLPNSNPLEWAGTPYSNFTKPTADLSGAIDTLRTAFDNLKTSITTMMDEAMSKLGEWMKTNIPGFDGFAHMWENIKKQIEIVAPHFTAMIEALGGAGGNGSAKNLIDGISGLFATLAEAPLEMIGSSLALTFDAIKIFVQFIQGVGNTFSNFVGDWNKLWHIDQTPWSASGTGKDNGLGSIILLDKTKVNYQIKDALSGVPTYFDINNSQSPLHDASVHTLEWAKDITASFDNMANDIVRHSIVPDMMSDVYDSMVGTMDTINIVLPGQINLMVSQFQRAIDKIDELIRKATQANISIPSSGGGGGGGTGGGGGRNIGYAYGGSFRIPPGFEGDSWSLGGGRYARSGELITVTPMSMSRSISNTETNNNYNLSVSSNMPVKNIIAQYDLIKALVQ